MLAVELPEGCLEFLEAAVEAAERVGRAPGADVLGPGPTPPLLRRQVGDRVRDAVVGEVGRDPAVDTRDGAGDPPGDVVRLRARVDEHHDVQRAAGRGGEPLGDLERRLVEVAHVRVQASSLADDRLDDPRMPVADDRDVVVRVEVAAAVGVDQPRAVAADEVQRLAVEEAGHGRADGPGAAFCEGRNRPPRPRLAPAETPRDLVPANRLELTEDRRAQFADAGLERLGVLVERAPRGRHDDGRAHPRGEELAEDRPLPRLERGHLLVAVERETSGSEEVVALAAVDDRLEDGGEIDDERRPARIAEVDDPGDLAVVVDEDVRGAQVGVDDLGAEARPDGRNRELIPVEGRRDELPDLGVAHGAEHRPETERVLDVPEHHPGRRRVPEPAQRPTDARGHRPPIANRLVAESCALHRRPTGQSVVHPDVVGAIRSLRRRPVRGRVIRLVWRAGHEPRKRDRDLRVDEGHALGCERLHVEPRRVLCGVRELQDGRSVAVDQERLVAFARDGSGHSVNTEQVAREGRRFVLREGRRRGGQDVVDGGIGHAVRLPARAELH